MTSAVSADQELDESDVIVLSGLPRQPVQLAVDLVVVVVVVVVVKYILHCTALSYPDVVPTTRLDGSDVLHHPPHGDVPLVIRLDLVVHLLVN